MIDMPPLFELDVVWIAREPKEPVDPQLFALLDAIAQTGKLTTAAAQIGLHYRQAWGLITLWSKTLGQPLVRKERGKGTHLTPLGETLLRCHTRIRDRLAPHLKKAATEIDQKIRPLSQQPHSALRVSASHDMLLMEFRNLLQSHPGPQLDIEIAGSLGSIMALAKSRCEIAGFHFPEGELGQDVLREFRPWLKPRTQILIHFVRRSQGLVVARGNPLNIAGLADIIKTKARFISRPRGSGTQIALELMLERCGIDKKRIVGFGNEEYTHAAIASAVASGAADVGLGIETAARKLDIDFVPLFVEDYYLLAKRETIEREDVREILSAMRSSAFRKIASRFSGYDVSRSGIIVEVEDAIRVH